MRSIRWLDEAYPADALFDAHRDDPESDQRFLLDEVRAAGEAMAERTSWRTCRDNGWWTAFGKGLPRRPLRHTTWQAGSQRGINETGDGMCQ
ncbi:hypothetical protein O1L60_40595 [Streptomyces diastatochromogenes]|nr:hypothetical protein [Streptomyces diastatochromogenes]